MKKPPKCSDVKVVHSEMSKMEVMIARLKMMRYMLVEVVVKGVHDKSLVIDFLVTFAGIQETLHRQAVKLSERAGTVVITVQAFDASH